MDSDDRVAGGEDREASLKLWVVMNRAMRAVGEHLRRNVEAQGLHPSEFAMLEALLHKGSLTLGEVGERVLLTSGSVTRVADKMEERGLIRRRPSAEDRRVCQVELTDEGRELIERVFPPHAESLQAAMGGLTVEEKRIATAMIRRLGRYAAQG